MKKLKYIQELIKNQQKLCIFIDYKDIIEEFESTFEPDILSARHIRILQNFSKCEFINMFILTNTDMPKKKITKLSKKLEDITFENYNAEDITNICDQYKETHTFMYLGKSPEIIQLINENSGMTISIKDFSGENKTQTDISLSKQKFEEILLETNNICL